MGFKDGLSYHNGKRFFTYDHDNLQGCGKIQKGGWWCNYCSLVDLNGPYYTPGKIQRDAGLVYYSFKHWEALKPTRMMFRRV
jgi:hypothetical protein